MNDERSTNPSMSEISVRPVRGRRERRIFLGFPWKIYAQDALWVPPIYAEQARICDPVKSPFIQRGGKVEFFIAWKDGKPVGTICAAEDVETNARRGTKDCMIGFFECIADECAAQALFAAAEDWARPRGLETLYGPFNLDYEEAYGVLVEGRRHPPALLCGHTPAYYEPFFVENGFVPARGQNLAFELALEDSPALLRLTRAADIARKQGRATVRSADFSQWEAEAERVLVLMNTALAHLPDFIPWTPAMIHELLSPFKQIADPELILFAEMDGKTVGFLPGIPDLNEAFIYANGMRHPWDYLRFLYHLRQPRETMTVKSVLVLPEYWGSAAGILLMDELLQRARKKGYRRVDLSITSDDNPNTPQLAENLGAKVYKRYQVYRKYGVQEK